MTSPEKKAVLRERIADSLIEEQLDDLDETVENPGCDDCDIRTCDWPLTTCDRRTGNYWKDLTLDG